MPLRAQNDERVGRIKGYYESSEKLYFAMKKFVDIYLNVILNVTAPAAYKRTFIIIMYLPTIL